MDVSQDEGKGAPMAPVPASAVVGVGCVTSVAGFFSGGMIAVLIGKVAGWATRCTPPEGLPACNWHIYAFIGGVIGMITLPSISIWRLKSRRS